MLDTGPQHTRDSVAGHFLGGSHGVACAPCRTSAIAVHHLCGLRCTMPTSNPRLTITLKPSTAAQLRRISELTGNSQSSLIAELLETSEPMFQRLITLLQAATDAKAALSQELLGSLEEAQGKLEGQLGLTLDIFDAGAKPILDAAEQITRRARKGAAQGDARSAPRAAATKGPTPLSNRGVRSTPKKTKKSTRTRG